MRASRSKTFIRIVKVAKIIAIIYINRDRHIIIIKEYEYIISLHLYLVRVANQKP